MTILTVRQWVCLALSAGLVIAALLLPWEPKQPPAPSSIVDPTPSATLSMARPEGVARGGRPVELVASVIGKPTLTAAPAAAPIIELSKSVNLGMFKITGYSNEDPTVDGRGITRSGERTRWGVAAVDPAVIPLGSTLSIEGMGFFQALDTGGGIRGNWLDLWFPTKWEAERHGVQWAEVRRVVP